MRSGGNRIPRHIPYRWDRCLRRKLPARTWTKICPDRIPVVICQGRRNASWAHIFSNKEFRWLQCRPTEARQGQKAEISREIFYVWFVCSWDRASFLSDLANPVILLISDSFIILHKSGAANTIVVFLPAI